MPDDARRQELITKISQLADHRFGGDARKMFKHYDRNLDNRISMGELISLLGDAGVGYRITRQVWAQAIIDELDSDQDDRISWEEFEAVLVK